MLIVQRPTIEEEIVSDDRSRFVVEPLEPGFGYTLGNTLRRTLLSRIPGAAITSVRIEGVQHEFSTIEGVVEDVVDFILNLKQVVLRIDADEPQTLYLSAKGTGEVTAVVVPVEDPLRYGQSLIAFAQAQESSGQHQKRAEYAQGAGHT